MGAVPGRIREVGVCRYQLEAQADPHMAYNKVADAIRGGDMLAARSALDKRGSAETEGDIAALRQLLATGPSPDFLR